MSLLVGVTRKQLGLTFLGETKQEFSSVVGDICLEVEGLDRKVRAFSCLGGIQYETIRWNCIQHWHVFGNRSSDLWVSISQYLYALYSIFVQPYASPNDDIPPDGYQFTMTLKEYEPKQLVADEKLLFQRMSKLLGHEINFRKIVFLSEYR